ncbi:MAG TPA: D-glycero-beta-D-manno-heptose-7-phosphate kinase [Deltaproteobacteria bacterium]|nr:D-glycero-beta-D-manno-heptose-7-phosphate kinase [Deltaproteobacteria bacterium]
MRRYLSVRKGRALIDGFAGARVLIIGDLIMDHFIWGTVRRISPEAPVPVVDVTSESILLGGCANVVNNIHSLGGRCLVTGVIGRDDDGKRLVKALRERSIPTDGIFVDAGRPTTIKTRVIAHNQQVVRFDRENKKKISEGTCRKVLAYVKKTMKEVDVVVISDYSKGLVSAGLVEEVTALARDAGKIVAVDPKVEHFDYYRGVTLVTPNNDEASRASAVEIEDEESLLRAGTRLRERLGCRAVLITRGEHGMSLFDGDDVTHIPTVAKEVYDVSGAGDTVIGVMALALAAGAAMKEAAVLANFAAGVVVGKVGTATVSPDELAAALGAEFRRRRR